MRLVRTVEEADTLPDGAVLVHRHEQGLPTVAQRNSEGWSLLSESWGLIGLHSVELALPGYLLWPVEEPARPTPRPTTDIIIIRCGKKKLDHSARARDMYTSQHFKAMRDYAEASGKPWFILSAGYGLLSPDSLIEPCDLTIGQLVDPYLSWWRVRVARRLIQDFGDPGQGAKLRNLTIELHVGKKYADAIGDILTYWGATITQPTAGMQIGERLAWYKKQRGATSC